MSETTVEYAAVVRSALPYPPNEHHRNCDSREHDASPGDCDCYAQRSNAAHEALDSMEAERQQAIDALRELIGAVERENRKLLNPSKVWPMSINVRHAVREGNDLLVKLGEKPQ